MKGIIILTACVKPGQMVYTELQDTAERLKQYKAALKYYLTHTRFKIIFCENSNTDFSNEFSGYIREGRLEYLAFNGNCFDRNLGKGYGEAIILKHIYTHSLLLKECDYTIKITGRIIVDNLGDVLKQLGYIKRTRFIICDANCKLTAAPSKLIIAYKDFYPDFFFAKAERINDSAHFTFEKALAAAIKEMKKHRGSHTLFATYPIYTGISGTNNLPIRNHSRIERKLKYILHKIGIWGRT